jgi:hypothetical protein
MLIDHTKTSGVAVDITVSLSIIESSNTLSFPIILRLNLFNILSLRYIAYLLLL